ncbi:MAG: HPr family phosphocarrier protein [Enterocloster sp.]
MNRGEPMVTRRMDIRKGGCNPIPISYLIQTANQFDCDIFVTNDNTTANLKRYDEMKRLNMWGFLTFCFKGSDENAAESRIHTILWKDTNR